MPRALCAVSLAAAAGLLFPLIAQGARAPQVNDFAGAPPVPGTRRVLAAGEAPESYTVQPGDTLFDICDQLLGEASYWPKLWSLNPEIKNPHYVFPGMQIRFYPGDPEIPPYLLVSTSDEALPVDQGPVAPEDLVISSPLQDRVDAAGISNFDLVDGSDIPVPEEISREILVSGKIFRRRDVVVDLPAFIVPVEADPDGYVVAGGNGQMLVDDSGEILLEESGRLLPGEIYTIVRDSGQVVDRRPEGDGDLIGNRYEFIGHVRVLRGTESGLYLGKVIDGRLPPEPEDFIIPFVATRKQFIPEVAGPSKEVPALVIGFDREHQLVGGEGNIVMLKLKVRGSVAEGDLLDVYTRPEITRPKAGSNFFPDKIKRATVRILEVRGEIATAYIVKSNAEVAMWDTTTRKSL
ncbi:MAG: hypothetical protein RIQ81_414 [Pseudomonadota bacterium]